jgi:hypothetical protein
MDDAAPALTIALIYLASFQDCDRLVRAFDSGYIPGGICA